MADLTANHIGQALGGFEPQRKNNFSFEVDVPFAGGRTLIKLALSAAFIPKIEMDSPILINYQNEQVQFAGKPKPAGSGTMKFHDYVDQNVRDALLSWFYLVYNPINGAVGLASQYKRDASIVLYAPDGSYSRLWKLKGCWPSSFDFGEVSYADNGEVEISMTMNYDKPVPLKGNGSNLDITGVQIGSGGGIPFTGISI